MKKFSSKYPMEYNTLRNELVLPEYGRNIQKMVEYAVTIEDREERNKAAQAIIKIMTDLSPQQKDQAEFVHRLWDYLFMMSDYKLDIDGPFERPEKEVLQRKPEKLPYSNKRFKYRYYGNNIEVMIERAKDLSEGFERDYFVNAIASYMKMSYRIWNEEKVADDVILEDLEKLSDGKIKLDKIVELNKNYDTHLNKGGGGGKRDKRKRRKR